MDLDSNSPIDSQMVSQVDSKLDSQLDSQQDLQLDSQLNSQLDSQLDTQLDPQLNLHEPNAAAFSTVNSSSQLVLKAKARLQSSVYATKNGRRKMEDKYTLIDDLNALGVKSNKQYSYYAVFDGHAGDEAATFASQQLHINLINNDYFESGDIKTALQEAFTATDRQYLAKCQAEGKKSGSTAVCCLIEDKSKIYFAWVGDSLAVLFKNGQPQEIMSPHKPNRPDELQRIKREGGVVNLQDTWRVNGTLAVSRAIGDPEFKPWVISDPDINEVTLDGSEDFLVLGCDGLWDHVSPEDTSCLVYHHLVEASSQSPANIVESCSKKLVECAKEGGSLDNITAIVVFLREINDIQGALSSMNVNQDIGSFNEANICLSRMEMPSSSPSILANTNGSALVEDVSGEKESEHHQSTNQNEYIDNNAVVESNINENNNHTDADLNPFVDQANLCANPLDCKPDFNNQYENKFDYSHGHQDEPDNSINFGIASNWAEILKPYNQAATSFSHNLDQVLLYKNMESQLPTEPADKINVALESLVHGTSESDKPVDQIGQMDDFSSSQFTHQTEFNDPHSHQTDQELWPKLSVNQSEDKPFILPSSSSSFTSAYQTSNDDFVSPQEPDLSSQSVGNVPLASESQDLSSTLNVASYSDSFVSMPSSVCPPSLLPESLDLTHHTTTASLTTNNDTTTTALATSDDTTATTTTTTTITSITTTNTEGSDISRLETGVSEMLSRGDVCMPCTKSDVVTSPTVSDCDVPPQNYVFNVAPKNSVGDNLVSNSNLHDSDPFSSISDMPMACAPSLSLYQEPDAPFNDSSSPNQSFNNSQNMFDRFNQAITSDMPSASSSTNNSLLISSNEPDQFTSLHFENESDEMKSKSPLSNDENQALDSVTTKANQAEPVESKDSSSLNCTSPSVPADEFEFVNSYKSDSVVELKAKESRVESINKSPKETSESMADIIAQAESMSLANQASNQKLAASEQSKDKISVTIKSNGKAVSSNNLVSSRSVASKTSRVSLGTSKPKIGTTEKPATTKVVKEAVKKTVSTLNARPSKAPVAKATSSVAPKIVTARKPTTATATAVTSKTSSKLGSTGTTGSTVRKIATTNNNVSSTLAARKVPSKLPNTSKTAAASAATTTTTTTTRKFAPVTSSSLVSKASVKTPATPTQSNTQSVTRRVASLASSTLANKGPTTKTSASKGSSTTTSTRRVSAGTSNTKAPSRSTASSPLSTTTKRVSSSYTNAKPTTVNDEKKPVPSKLVTAVSKVTT